MADEPTAGYDAGRLVIWSDMAEYREIAPSPRLAQTIECFWTMNLADADPLHRVVPDGCADILFSRDGARRRSRRSAR